MKCFDASLDWNILLKRSDMGGIKSATEDLRRIINSLRQSVMLDLVQIPLWDASTAAPHGDKPLIVLTYENTSIDTGTSSIAWRAEKERIEIIGSTPLDLRKGIYDFIDALGFRYPRPGIELMESKPEKATRFPLVRNQAYIRNECDRATRKRLYLPGTAIMEEQLRWAARNGYDAVILNLQGVSATGKPHFLRDSIFRRGDTNASLAEYYGLSVELGGPLLSEFIPRHLFFNKRNLFRMESGRRLKDKNFCPTNPDVLRLLSTQSRRFFSLHREYQCFHLWLDTDIDLSAVWCSCPSCRAFTPMEQLLMSLNICADALAESDPTAVLSYPEDSAYEGTIQPRNNMIPMKIMPPPVSPPGPS